MMGKVKTHSNMYSHSALFCPDHVTIINPFYQWEISFMDLVSSKNFIRDFVLKISCDYFGIKTFANLLLLNSVNLIFLYKFKLFD